MKWSNIQIPKEMVDKIREVITNYPSLGYTSLSNFIADSVRRRLDELKEKI